MFKIPQFAKRILSLTGLAVFAIFHSANSFAFTQAESQNVSANINHRGSDDDQDLATRNAMKAFMNLAALNIPGAISKGYEAYGNYINSEKLDELEAKTRRLRNNMGSAGGIMGGSGGGSTGSGATADSGVSGTSSARRITTLSNLDPSFLYRGETAQVAEEFEKRSGMKREEFFKHLSSITDAHYSWDDPDLQAKLEARFQAFKERIPNKEFKAGLERVEAMVPNAIRVKMMGEAMAFYKNAYKNDGHTVAATPSLPQELAVASATAPAAVPTAAATAPTPTAEASASGDRTIASLAAPNKEGVYPRTMGMYIGLNQNDDALNSLVQGTNTQTEADTIFAAVSLRYRKLTPGLVGKKFVGDAR